MSTEYINVDELAESIVEEEKRQIAHIAKRNDTPSISAILIGDSPACARKLGRWGSVCQEADVPFHVHQFPADVDFMALHKRAGEIVSENGVTGVAVSRSPESSISRQQSLMLVPFKKDIAVEGPVSLGRILSVPENAPLPPECGTVMAILDANDIDIYDKTVLVVGEIESFCLPISAVLSKKHAVISMASVNASFPEPLASEADLIIVNGFEPQSIDADCLKKDAIVLDMGPASNGNGVLTEKAAEKAGKVLPAGGADRMEQAMFLHNVVEYARNLESGPSKVVLNGDYDTPFSAKDARNRRK